MNPYSNLQGNMGGMGAQGPNMFAEKGHPSGPVLSSKPAGVTKTLYIGNLGKTITEETLQPLLSRYTGYMSVRVMKDFFTGLSRGFAFATFANKESAEVCVNQLNYTVVEGRELKVCFKKSPADFKQDANVFVKNIPPTMTSRQLEEEGASSGKIISSTVRYSDEGKSLGYGYIQYDSKESADKCIQKLNGLEIGGYKIIAGMFIPKGKRGIKTQNNLYLRNFPSAWKEEEINKFIDDSFGEYGEITSKGVLFSKDAGSYYAFVCFKEAENAKKAYSEMNDFEMEGGTEKLYVNYAQSKEARRKMFERNSAGKIHTNLYMKGVKESVSETMIKDIFQEFGEVTSTCLKRKNLTINGEEVKSGFAFINFKNADQCKEALLKGKTSPQVLELVNLEMVKENEFLFYAQPKAVRTQFLKMKNKSKRNPYLDIIQKMAQSGISQSEMFRLFSMQNRGMIPGINPAMGGFNSMMGMNGRMMPYNQQMNGYRGMMMPTPMVNMNQFNMPRNYAQMPMMNPRMMNPTPMMNPNPGFLNPNQNIMNNVQAPQMTQMNQKKPVNRTSVPDMNFIDNHNEEFLKMDDELKKKALGTILYPLIKQIISKNDPENADEMTPKVTGMLIDLEVLSVEDILDSIKTEEVLARRIKEALDLIKEEQEKNQVDINFIKVIDDSKRGKMRENKALFTNPNAQNVQLKLSLCISTAEKKPILKKY